MSKLIRFLLTLSVLAMVGFAPQAVAQNCPCSIWTATTTPGMVDSGDASSGEFGVRFRADVNGTMTGIRFYKSAANTGFACRKSVDQHRHTAGLGGIRGRVEHGMATGDFQLTRRDHSRNCLRSLVLYSYRTLFIRSELFLHRRRRSPAVARVGEWD